ncbi:MAG TPA: ribbon-helix-helix protein, CopG family [Gemmatimonadaceae bacterium]|nr:ribbon-helix-helix protein, CopG family [Gemmatimonadaceae bacterium]
MKNSHLTLRIPAALARTLDRLAHIRGVPKSQVVREAVASYLVPTGEGASPAVVTGAELAKRWASIPRLDPAEASELASDIADARAAVPPLVGAWT